METDRERAMNQQIRAMNQKLLAKFKNHEFTTYDLTQKQNHDFQQWKERQMKSEEEKRRKQPFMLMSMSMRPDFDIFNKERKYFDRWIQEQKKKGEVFKVKTYGKK
jgi:hypothetical protein